jgi:hypothetical protein
MNFQPQHQMDEGLWDWLQIATEGLCQNAVTRIILEIEAHYKEALIAHEEEGKSVAEARAMSLQELGDAKRAAKRFRKKHLTEKEHEKLEKLTADAFKPCSKSHLAIEIVGFLCLVATVPLLRNLFPSFSLPFPIFFLIAPAILSILQIWMSRILVKQFPARSISIRLAVAHGLFQIIYDCAYLVIWYWVLKPNSLAICLFYCLLFMAAPFLVNVNPWMRIWQKIRRDKDGFDMVHSGSNPTSAS